MVQAVLGQPGLLLYGLKKVLLTMDFHRGIVEWVELEYILNQWGISRGQFVDICLLAGTEYCLTFPFLNLDYFQQDRATFSFQSAVDFIRQMPLANWMSSFPDEKMRNEHVDGYCVCKSLLSYCPVLNLTDLQVEPLSTPNIPHDLSKLVGEKLPQALYSLLTMGHVSYRIPSVLATGEWNDRQAPLIDSLEYRSLVVELEEYRAKILGLITCVLPGDRRKKLVSKTYFDAPASGGRELKPVPPSGLNWKFTREDLTREMKRQNIHKVDVLFCLKWHAHDYETNGPLIRNATTNTSQFIPTDTESLTAVVCLMILETLDYIAPDGSMTVLGDVIKDSPIAFEEPILLAIELMKFGLLTGEPLEAPTDKPFPAAVAYPSTEGVDSRTRSVMLISRVISLVPMKLKNDLWSAKVDFDLAAFHCLVRAMNRSMRLIVEACVANHVVSDVKRSGLLLKNSQAPNGPVPSEILASTSANTPTSILPSFMLPRACLGILVKYFLDYSGKSFEADVKKKFPCFADPIADLKAGLIFWDELIRVVSAVAEPLGTTGMLDEMKAANQLILEKRKLL
jgi:hypothetical protein